MTNKYQDAKSRHGLDLMDFLINPRLSQQHPIPDDIAAEHWVKRLANSYCECESQKGSHLHIIK